MSSIPGVINLDIVLRNYVTLFKVGLTKPGSSLFNSLTRLGLVQYGACWPLLSPSPENKKNLTLILKSFLFFLKRKLFLHFVNGNTKKSSLYLRKQSFLIFQETETLKNFGRTFQAQNIRKPTLNKIS